VRFSKLIVSLVVFLNVIFTVAVLCIFYRTGVEPAALIVAWFAFTTGELFFLSSIEKSKIRKESGYAKGLDDTVKKQKIFNGGS